MSLFALEIVFFAYHMRQSRWNLPVLKYAVLLMILNDALGTVCGCAYYVYYFLVDLARAPQWPLAVVLVSTGLSAFIEQSYLIRRYWKVSGNTFFCVFLVLSSVTHVWD
ncbi:hypothetical protein GGX14DRAFT_479938 [Mycena pura]|uniref:Uncharacterized protein n=1 Tax=Mycena pura TaxID=153505 RepID=A0AAD6XZT7_9AGAR|nr:hypothetical protein GGX14DRAFT_479938 [Mycena pura]